LSFVVPVKTGTHDPLYIEPYFSLGWMAFGTDEIDEAGQSPKVGRNASCPCGSGKKYKKCCPK